jgi:hypothetical protein
MRLFWVVVMVERFLPSSKFFSGSLRIYFEFIDGRINQAAVVIPDYASGLFLLCYTYKSDGTGLCGM